MAIATQWHVFKEILYTNVLIFMRDFWDRLINIIIWTGITLWVSAYIMPAFGINQSYGAFMLASLLASVGSFGLFPNIVNFVSDLEGPNILSYYLTLPISGSVVLVCHMIYYALTGIILSGILIPLGVTMIPSFSLGQVSFIRLAIMIILANLFYGAFTLWVASFIKNMLKIGNVWMRFVFPLWFLGGFQFSWSVLYKVSPVLGTINLLNPVMYAMEGFRIALLGPQASSLHFWHCCLGLLIALSSCACWSILRLKKRLDFI
ncbi:MAG TPA: hypothetical protein VHA52_00430 [Candidatus Babeliaceae bacterium]|nr:hypothetical protein [Candidatus Babeliaceae bacterium]